MKIFRFLKNTLDVIVYLMAIVMGLDIILLEFGYGHLIDFVFYVVEYFV